MENKNSNKQQTSTASKKHHGTPTYGDQPWQKPQYGEKKKNSKDAQKDEESCGCE